MLLEQCRHNNLISIRMLLPLKHTEFADMFFMICCHLIVFLRWEWIGNVIRGDIEGRALVCFVVQQRTGGSASENKWEGVAIT